MGVGIAAGLVLGLTVWFDYRVSRDELVEKERQAALGALVPVVAHNIRNPLASIRASAQNMSSPATQRAQAPQATL